MNHFLLIFSDEIIAQNVSNLLNNGKLAHKLTIFCKLLSRSELREKRRIRVNLLDFQSFFASLVKTWLSDTMISQFRSQVLQMTLTR